MYLKTPVDIPLFVSPEIFTHARFPHALARHLGRS